MHRRGVVVVTNLGVVRGSPDRVQSEVRSGFVAQSPETLIYDGDGNLVRDGRWMYSWDAENRLVRVMSYGATDRASWRRVDWAYDALGRRTRQTTYVLSNGVWVVTEDLKFVSDPVLFGRHIAELNATNYALVRSYVWGLDLSETLDGAGGVGGLLWVRLPSGPASGTHFVTYDGNGNVWQLVSASTGTETARYEYGPFGESIRATGPLAEENSFGFSTKRTHRPTRLVLYEFRHYDPDEGRWLNRDRIEERGGRNLYGFVRNNPIRLFDYLGLARKKCSEAIGKNGQPRIVFDPSPPKGGWKAISLDFEKQGSAQAQLISMISVTWEARVAVLCKCDSCYEIRHGTRTYEDQENGAWLIADPTQLPTSPFPIATTMLEIIGGFIADEILENVAIPIPADAQNGQEMVNAVKRLVHRRPTKPYDGGWKDGKSPCDK